jgi:hypothetical protein
MNWSWPTIKQYGTIYVEVFKEAMDLRMAGLQTEINRRLNGYKTGKISLIL